MLALQFHKLVSCSFISVDILQGEHGDVYIASQGFHAHVLMLLLLQALWK